MHAFDPEPPTPEMLSRITMPVLLLAGDGNVYYPLSESEVWRDKLQAAGVGECVPRTRVCRRKTLIMATVVQTSTTKSSWWLPCYSCTCRPQYPRGSSSCSLRAVQVRSVGECSTPDHQTTSLTAFAWTDVFTRSEVGPRHLLSGFRGSHSALRRQSLLSSARSLLRRQLSETDGEGLSSHSSRTGLANHNALGNMIDRVRVDRVPRTGAASSSTAVRWNGGELLCTGIILRVFSRAVWVSRPISVRMYQYATESSPRTASPRASRSFAASQSYQGVTRRAR